ncbi:hypothetical protein A9Q84_19640 [Halobacteriovorax marinus]|uniref:Outer membrane lipoprotein carrier protein LolA n=1 Tax=Halobacteriovorax marinus TaxID=97084 RepID=A0A1Y5F8F3_9BACT|nr:hypothetical protein A9Q84_19640 [Halobacteriovorax marinus]
MTKILFVFFLLSTQIFAKSFVPKNFSASFEQVYKSALTGKEKRSKGQIDYSYPSSIKLITSSPESLTYVSNRDKTWYYTPPFIEGEPGQLTVQEATKNTLTKFLNVLKKGLKSNKVYSVKMLKNSYLLSFKKKAKKQLGIKEATLFFKNNQAKFRELKTVKMILTNKKVKVLELSKINESPKFNKNHFVFTAPKNTKVNK